jgi:hypothetical protein
LADVLLKICFCKRLLLQRSNGKSDKFIVLCVVCVSERLTFSSTFVLLFHPTVVPFHYLNGHTLANSYDQQAKFLVSCPHEWMVATQQMQHSPHYHSNPKLSSAQDRWVDVEKAAFDEISIEGTQTFDLHRRTCKIGEISVRIVNDVGDGSEHVW